MSSHDETLVSLHRERAEGRPHHPAIVFKAGGGWQALSWRDYFEQSQACAAALVGAGISPGDRVGLLSENRSEWLVADLGIMAAGAVTVPLHATTTDDYVETILRDAGVRWLFVSDAAQREKVRRAQGSLPGLRGIVTFEGEGERGEISGWGEWLRGGGPGRFEPLARRREDLGPDSLATIIYTSGTTGRPKGVMLTHRNLLTTARAVDRAFPTRADAVILAWLPFSHVIARSIDHFMSVLTGCTVWLAESPEKVLENIALARSTHLSAVPRLYEKVAGALAGASPAERKARLRAIFGPPLERVTCGGAPLSPSVSARFEEAGVPILEGYGLTETSGVLASNRPEAYRPGTVGRPLPGLEVRVAPDGEILARGPNVTGGFWNDPEATREAIRDGWLHTGDLGVFDDDGFLTITGRKKELLILSTGKKVVPTHVEGLLAADPCIEQVVVYGEGRRFLTALVVPSAEIRGRLSDPAGPGAAAREDALRLLSRRVADQLTHLPPEMQVKRFLIVDTPWSPADGSLTVTLKPRREVIFARHQVDLDGLYTADPAPAETPVGVPASP